MPLKCQKAVDLTRNVIDEIVAKAEFNRKLVSQWKTDFIRALLLRWLMEQEARGGKKGCRVIY